MCILPAFGMATFRRVGVRKFIDHDQFRPARQRGVEVEFLDLSAAIIDLAARQNVEPLDQRGRLSAAVGLDQADHNIHALSPEMAGVLKHETGFADAWRGAKKNFQTATPLLIRQRLQRVGLGATVSCEFAHALL